MLVSMWSVPPPDALLGVADQGELCRNGMSGLAQVEPISASVMGLPGLVGAVQSIFGVSPAQQMAKAQLKFENAQLKAEKQAAAQQFALDQLRAKTDPSEQRRDTEIYALYAVGGIAAIITLAFILKTVNKKGPQE